MADDGQLASSSLMSRQTHHALRDEAMQNAISRVAELFSQPDQLNEVLEFQRKSVEQRKVAVEAKLKGAIQTELEEARSALSLMNNSMTVIKSIRHDFVTIDSTCKEAENLIDEYPLIRRLNTVRCNCTDTREQVFKLLAIPTKLQEVLAILKNEDSLLVAHTEIKELERLRMQALFAARKSKKELEVLLEEYKEVTTLADLHAEKLWSVIDRCMEVARTKPELLVKCARVIDREEKMDKLAKDADNLERRPGPFDKIKRHYRRELMSRFDAWIDARFRLAFEVDDGADAPSLSDQCTRFLEVQEEMLAELDTVAKSLAPAFPPSYQLFELFVERYHAQFHTLITSFVAQRRELSPPELLGLIEWMSWEYPEFLRFYQVEASMQPSLSSGTSDMVAAYRSAIAGQLANWSERIVKMDQEASIEKDEMGRCVTDAPVTIFKIVNQQLDTIADSRSPDMIRGIVAECVLLLERVQTRYTKILRDEWKNSSFYYLLAQVNNMLKCRDFTETLQDKLRARGVGAEEQLNEIIERFTEVSQLGATAVERFIFDNLDQAIVTLYTKDWYANDPNIMTQIAATLEDYFENDIDGNIPETVYRSLVRDALQGLVGRVVKHLLEGKKPPFRKDAGRIMEEDEQVLTEFQLKFIARKAVVDENMQILVWMRNLLSADPQAVCLYFDNLVQDGGIPANKLVRMINDRADLTDAQKTEALANCSTAAGVETESKASGLWRKLEGHLVDFLEDDE